MKILSLYFMSFLYVAAGVFHFVRPDFYMKIMPSWLPWHSKLVFTSGIIEIILGIFLIPTATRTMAAWGIIAFLIAVFPANIQMAINYWNKPGFYYWISILRLPFQLVLIWWAWQYTK